MKKLIILIGMACMLQSCTTTTYQDGKGNIVTVSHNTGIVHTLGSIATTDYYYTPRMCPTPYNYGSRYYYHNSRYWNRHRIGDCW